MQFALVALFATWAGSFCSTPDDFGITFGLVNLSIAVWLMWRMRWIRPRRAPLVMLLFFLAGLWVAVGNHDDKEGWPAIILGIAAFFAALFLLSKATVVPPTAQ